jgi:metal-responsive CopG/Arc/MetJ family transcriptional regulator
MSSSKRVQFRAPEQLIEQADVLATAEDRDRTEVLIEALRAYLSESAENENVKRDIANAYYEGSIEYEQMKAVLGPKEAENLRLLKDQLEDRELAEEIADL